MATTGTFNFSPTAGSITLTAFGRIQHRRAALTAEHLATAREEINLAQSSWSNMGPNLWTVDEQTIVLAPGVASYSVPATTIQLLEAWISDGGVSDSPLISLSRTDYANLPNKAMEGIPTCFWLARTIAPQITLFPVPNSARTLKYFRYRTQQDADLARAQSVEVPQRWHDAIVADLAHRLARHYRPELEDKRLMDAQRAWDIASGADIENAPVSFNPDISRYTP